MKAGNKKKGKLHQGCFLPLYGDQDEMVFNYSSSKSRSAIESVLSGFSGKVLLTDGNSAYALYVKKIEALVHALCWSHNRKYFERAFEDEPVEAKVALDLIAKLHHEDGQIDKDWSAAKQIEHRATRCKPIVDRFFDWCHKQRQRADLLPKNRLVKALRYACEREQALREFLTDPSISLDTNHLERGLRVIPMGRRNWLFCWTELDAKYAGIIQSLIVTCRPQDVDPTTYLIDVLQRINHIQSALNQVDLETGNLSAKHV
jgi:transposase